MLIVFTEDMLNILLNKDSDLTSSSTLSDDATTSSKELLISTLSSEDQNTEKFTKQKPRIQKFQKIIQKSPCPSPTWWRTRETKWPNSQKFQIPRRQSHISLEKSKHAIIRKIQATLIKI